MFLVNTALSDNLGIADAGILALLGYAVVFFGLILLMLVVMILGSFFIAKAKKKDAPAAVPAAPVAPAAPVIPASQAAPAAAPAADAAAPGTAGQLKLYDTPPKTAAMIMAIVANRMNKPLNELRFISIKEVEKK